MAKIQLKKPEKILKLGALGACPSRTWTRRGAERGCLALLNHADQFAPGLACRFAGSPVTGNGGRHDLSRRDVFDVWWVSIDGPGNRMLAKGNSPVGLIYGGRIMAKKKKAAKKATKKAAKKKGGKKATTKKRKVKRKK
jgi:hypothetical protein